MNGDCLVSIIVCESANVANLVLALHVELDTMPLGYQADVSKHEHARGFTYSCTDCMHTQ